MSGPIAMPMFFIDYLFAQLKDKKGETFNFLLKKEEEVLSTYVSCIYELTKADDGYVWKTIENYDYPAHLDPKAKRGDGMELSERETMELAKIIENYQIAKESLNKLKNYFYYGKIMIINSSKKDSDVPIECRKIFGIPEPTKKYCELTNPTIKDFVDALWLINHDKQKFISSTSVINNNKLIIQCNYY